MVRFHQQAFNRYKYGENLKILKEVFHQKPIVSDVVLAFSDHLKAETFFVV